MNPIQRSAKLNQEAGELLCHIKLAEICQEIGEITPTGSYYLDLMIYPDIDLYLPRATPRQLFNIATHLVENHPVVRVNFLNGGPGELKDALYIKPVIALGNWERPWKVDIWAAGESIIAMKQAELDAFRGKLTPELRQLILNYKFSILNEENRTPMFSGIHIYRAVLDHGLSDFAEITAYLREQGITI
jgi:hypothetical protein